MSEEVRSTREPAAVQDALVAAEQLPLPQLQWDREKPTEASFDQLSDWVIWQFPRPRRQELCGAVHPPVEGYGWLPATIDPQKQRLRIYAHVAMPFSSPEEAVAWFTETK